MSHHAHDAEMRECAECDAEYDLARQSYYGPLCPACYQDEHGEQATWPRCPFCHDRYEPGTGSRRTVYHMHGPSETVAYCGDCR